MRMSEIIFVLISRLTGECATQNLKKTNTILVYVHVHILWTYFSRLTGECATQNLKKLTQF